MVYKISKRVFQMMLCKIEKNGTAHKNKHATRRRAKRSSRHRKKGIDYPAGWVEASISAKHLIKNSTPKNTTTSTQIKSLELDQLRAFHAQTLEKEVDAAVNKPQDNLKFDIKNLFPRERTSEHASMRMPHIMHGLGWGLSYSWNLFNQSGLAWPQQTALAYVGLLLLPG